MTNDVEISAAATLADDGPSLADVLADALATLAIGLILVILAIGAGLALLVGHDSVSEAIRNTIAQHNSAEADLGVALLNDGAALLAVLGLVLVTRTSRRGTWLAMTIGALVGVCVADHGLLATRSARFKGFSIGPTGDPMWQAACVDGRHLAWSLAIALMLACVADVARRGGFTRFAGRTPFVAVAWPLVAAVVVVAARLPEWLALDWVVNVPWHVAVLVEASLLFATMVLVVRVEWRVVRAWNVARRRVDVASPAGDTCIRCAYDLRGIADDAPCPECGLLAGRSRTRASAHLRDASPSWLRGIARGVTLILAAEVVGAAWPFAFDGLVMPRVAWVAGRTGLATGRLFGIDVDVGLLFLGPLLLAAATLFVGVWLLTRPQRSGARDGTLRGLLRTFAAVPIVTLGMTCWLERAASTMGGASPVVSFAMIALLTAGCAPLPALMFALLRHHARRVLNANLAEHATIVGVGLSLTLVAIPLLAVTLTLVDDDDRGLGLSSHSDVPMILLLCTVVSFVLFAGWSAVNCIRFALAFRRAHREAAALWSDADLAPGR